MWSKITFLCVCSGVFAMEVPRDDELSVITSADEREERDVRQCNGLFMSLASPNGLNISPKEWAEECLFDAVSDRNVERTKQLIGRGVSVNSFDRDGGQPIHYAAYNGSVTMLKLLHNAGASIEASDKLVGARPLHYAAARNCFGAVCWLLEMGSDINPSDFKGGTPLLYAILNKRYVTVKILLECGADPLHCSVYKANACDYADGDQCIVRMLRQRLRGETVCDGRPGDTPSTSASVSDSENESLLSIMKEDPVELPKRKSVGLQSLSSCPVRVRKRAMTV